MRVVQYLIVTAALTAATVTANATTVRESELILKIDGKTVTNAAFQANESSFEVSNGQPAGTPPVVASFTSSNHQLNIRVYAGRHKTSAVAKTFNNRTVERVATRRGEASGKPGELNFTFEGTLVLNGDSFENFSFGEGNKGTWNNWWAGTASQAVARAKDGSAYLCFTGASGTIYQMKMPKDDSNHLEVSAITGAESCGS